MSTQAMFAGEIRPALLHVSHTSKPCCKHKHHHAHGSKLAPAQIGLMAHVSAWVTATKNKATGFAQDTWAQMPSSQQMGVMAANAWDESVFQLTAPGGYVRKNPVLVSAGVAAAVTVGVAGYYAYSKGYFAKAYKALKARIAKQ